MNDQREAALFEAAAKFSVKERAMFLEREYTKAAAPWAKLSTKV